MFSIHLLFEEEQLSNPIWKSCYNSMKKIYNNFEIWNLDRIKKEFNLYSEYSKIQTIDAARYHILYRYAGAVIDMDVKILKDFTPYINEDKLNIITSYDKMYFLEPAFMYVKKKNHPTLKYIIDSLEKTKDIKDVFTSTGGIFLDNLKPDVHILKRPLFNCPSWIDCKDKVLIHLHTNSWV